jgi:hypothetical protein
MDFVAGTVIMETKLQMTNAVSNVYLLFLDLKKTYNTLD